MSYEGFSQFLCSKGHLWTEDCNSTAFELKGNLCGLCGEPAIWENMVDVTNGSYDDDGKRIDGYIDLEIERQDCCHECKQIIETTYKIPRSIKYKGKKKK